MQALDDDLDTALEKSFKENGAPGMVAAVQTPEYTWVGTLASEEPMTADVHHQIASVTKTFTSTLLLQAAAEGLLSLDYTVVVEVNSDIVSGDCPPDLPTMTDDPQGHPCQDPASWINRALAEALGRPFPPHDVSAILEKSKKRS